VFAAWAMALGGRLRSAIRIIRSPVSYNERPFQPGKYGEEILANSAD
jgi:hypothetical protein